MVAEMFHVGRQTDGGRTDMTKLSLFAILRKRMQAVSVLVATHAQHTFDYEGCVAV